MPHRKGRAASPSIVTDDHADVADWNDGLRIRLHAREPAIDEVGAVRQRLILSSASPPGCQKGFGILEVIVVVIGFAIVSNRR